jgi:hypothetical protein
MPAVLIAGVRQALSPLQELLNTSKWFAIKVKIKNRLEKLSLHL